MDGCVCVHACVCKILGFSILLYFLNFEAVCLVQRINCIWGRKCHGIISRGCELKVLPDSKPRGSLRYKETHDLSAASSPLPASLQSSKTPSALWRWESELQGPDRGTEAYMGREEGSLMGSADTPGLEPKMGWGLGFRWEQGPSGPCPLTLRFIVLLDESGPLWLASPWEVRSLNEGQEWGTGKHFCYYYSKSVWSSHQCDRAERLNVNFLKIIIGHNIQILKEFMSLENNNEL